MKNYKAYWYFVGFIIGLLGVFSKNHEFQQSGSTIAIIMIIMFFAEYQGS